MHLYETMKNFLLDFDYHIAVYENKIHIFNYVDIVKLTNTEIVLTMDKFSLVLIGENFAVKRLEKREILIEGIINSVGFQR